MSDLGLDADGFVDMDQFPDDGTDLGGDDLVDLRTALHADPVVEPSDEVWDDMFSEALAGGQNDGPFGLDHGLVATSTATPDCPE